MDKKKEKMVAELMRLFEKKPYITTIEKNRLLGELQIGYSVSKKTALDMIEAFMLTGRVAELPVMNDYECAMCEAKTSIISNAPQPMTCESCKRKALKLAGQREIEKSKPKKKEEVPDKDAEEVEDILKAKPKKKEGS